MVLEDILVGKNLIVRFMHVYYAVKLVIQIAKIIIIIHVHEIRKKISLSVSCIDPNDA